MKILQLITLFAFCSCFLECVSQNTLRWRDAQHAILNGGSLTQDVASKRSATALSEQVLYGTSKDHSGDGFFEFRANSIDEIKKIGFINLSDHSEMRDRIDYGVSFIKGGRFRVFGPDTVSPILVFSANDGFKVERFEKTMKIYRNSQLLITLPVNPSVNFNVKAIIRSSGGSFIGVTTSFNDEHIKISPTIDNSSKAVRLRVNEGDTTYKAKWVFGEASDVSAQSRVALEKFSPKTEGSYKVLVKDSKGIEVIRSFLVGNDVVWQNFNNSQFTSGTLSAVKGYKGWASATMNLFSSGDVKLECILKSIGGIKGFGLSASGTQNISPRKILAGFFIKENAAQIIIDGNTVFSTIVRRGDVLRVHKDKKGAVGWFKNGKKLLFEGIKPNLPLQGFGLVRDGGVLEKLTFTDQSPVYVTKNWIDTLGFGNITVSLNGISTINFPIQYKISSEPITELKEEYLFLTETLKLNIDSLSFFQGKDSLMSKTFSELAMGDYHIAVFDNSGRRVFSDKVHLQAPLRFLQQENLAVKDGVVSATSDEGSGELMLFLDSAATAVIDFKLSSVTEKTNSWFGFKKTKDTLVTDKNLMYGFFVKGRRLHFMEENGVVSENYSVLSNDDKLSINIMEDKVVYLQNGKEQHHVIRNNKDELNVVVGVTAEAHLEVQHDYLLNIEPYIFTLLDQKNLDCSGNGYGQFTFYVRARPQNNLGLSVIEDPATVSSNVRYFNPKLYYTIKNLSTNTEVQSGQSMIYPYQITPITIGSQSHPLEPGKYEIKLSYRYFSHNRWRTFTGLRYVYIGYNAVWYDVENYEVTNAPFSNSIERTISYDNGLTTANARAKNVTLSPKGWVTFDPKINNEPLGNIYSRLISSFNTLQFNYSSFNYNNFSIPYIRLLKRPSGMQNPGTKIVASGDSQYRSISGQNKLIIEYTQTGFKIYQRNNYYQNNLVTSCSYTPIPIVYGIKTTSAGKNNGFLNVVTSFGCRKPSKLFAEPTRKINSTVYKVYDNELLFYFNSEYFGNDSKLNYKIYSHMNRIQPVLSGSIQQKDVDFGDNRYKINVQSLYTNTGGEIAARTYVLVIENDKKEKFYLRFKK